MHLDYLNSVEKMWEYQLQSTNIANFGTRRFLQDEKVIWPSDALTAKFAELVEPTIRARTQNENLTLSALRDTLLPKLVSGELRV